MRFYCYGKQGLCDEEGDVLCGECQFADDRGGYLVLTNSDKLRSMKDKELAEFICKHMDSCDACPGADLCNHEDGKANGLLKWLKQPAKEIKPLEEDEDA